MSRVFFGADPGWKGGYAALDENGTVLFCHTFTNWKHVHSILSNKLPYAAMLEESHGFPGQSSKSIFSQGGNFHSWKALLEVNDVSYMEVPAKRWQKVILGTFPTGESKIRALAYAQRMWPTLELKKSDDGKVDALLMALYSKLFHTGAINEPLFIGVNDEKI